MRTKIKSLRCRECLREYPAQARHVCEFCFGPLEVVYDYQEIKKHFNRRTIERGPDSLWRYWHLLPVENPENIITRQEGFTPLIRAENLGKYLGLKNLYLKNDTVNPTFSFKDRVVTVAVSRAKELNFETVACASTGNLAASVSAYGSLAGFKAFVFIPADLEQGKILNAAVYGARIVAIKGNYDQVNRLCAEIADNFGWAFVNVNIRPYYAEGSKTLGFETAEQLGWRAPDCLVVPAASGSLLTKIYKGLKEFQDLGIIPSVKTRVFAAQAQGCAPIATAILTDNEIIRPVKPATIAKSLAIGNPADGFYAWRTVKYSGGSAAAVSDEEIIEGIKLLARTEGIFAETAGGVTVAALKKLVLEKKISPRDTTVIYITGNGLKTQEAIADLVKNITVIEPTLESFRRIL